MKTLLPEAYKFGNRCTHPLQFPLHYTILYMLQQSAEYVLSMDFVSTFKKVDFEKVHEYIVHPS